MTGRPTAYTPEIADQVLTRLADGETLRTICAGAGMPSRGAVQNWVERDYEGFAQRYRNARDHALAVMEDDLLAMADDIAEDPQRSKLQVDARKWLLSKRLPKVFGDRLEVTQTHDIADRLQRLRERDLLPGATGATGDGDGP